MNILSSTEMKLILSSYEIVSVLNVLHDILTLYFILIAPFPDFFNDFTAAFESDVSRTVP